MSVFPGLGDILLILLRARATSVIVVDLLNCERGNFNLLPSMQCKPCLFRLSNMYREA